MHARRLARPLAPHHPLSLVPYYSLLATHPDVPGDVGLTGKDAIQSVIVDVEGRQVHTRFISASLYRIPPPTKRHCHVTAMIIAKQWLLIPTPTPCPPHLGVIIEQNLGGKLLCLATPGLEQREVVWTWTMRKTSK